MSGDMQVGQAASAMVKRGSSQTVGGRDEQPASPFRETLDAKATKGQAGRADRAGADRAGKDVPQDTDGPRVEGHTESGGDAARRFAAMYAKLFAGEGLPADQAPALTAANAEAAADGDQHALVDADGEALVEIVGATKNDSDPDANEPGAAAEAAVAAALQLPAGQGRRMAESGAAGRDLAGVVMRAGGKAEMASVVAMPAADVPIRQKGDGHSTAQKEGQSITRILASSNGEGRLSAAAREGGDGAEVRRALDAVSARTEFVRAGEQPAAGKQGAGVDGGALRLEEGQTSRVTVVSAQSNLAAPASAPANPTAAALVQSLGDDPGVRQFAAAQSQIFEVVNQVRAAPAHSLKIQLHPASLGTVTANLHVSSGQLQIEIRVDSTEAHRQLSADADTMAKALRAVGYDVDRVTIVQQPQNQGMGQAPHSGRDGTFNPQGSEGERPSGDTGNRDGREGNKKGGQGDGQAGRDAHRSGLYI